MHAIERILAPLGRRVDEASPLCDARLADGSRVNVVIPPLSLSGPCLTIRRFRRQGFSLRDLVRDGTLPAERGGAPGRVRGRARVGARVSGGTGSGKTTTLNALSGAIPGAERIVTIEDAAELRLRQRHVVRLEARPANLEGRGEVTIRQLVRNALRMRPDRIVVGEVRGAEALDMLQALNTGHDGSLTTVHANSPADALRRVETLALMAGVGLPHAAVREQVASALDLVVHQARLPDGRARGRVGDGGRAGGGRRRHARALPPRRRSCGRRATARSRERLARCARRVAGEAARGGARRSRPAGAAARWALAEPRCDAGLAAHGRGPRRCGRRPRSSTSLVRRAARAATPARPSGGGCCWPARRSRSALGAALAGPVAGLALAAAGPGLVARVLRARRERYRRAVDAGCAADRGGGGRRPGRRPLAARRAVRGGRRRSAARPGTSCGAWRRSWPPGARTEDALEAMRAAARLGSASTRSWRPAWSSGAPAATWRGCCATARRRSRTRRGSRARSAPPPRRRASPALIVVLLPAGGALLAELASPGLLAGLLGSFLTAWLVGLALVLQVVAAVLIRRLGRVRW